MYHKRLEEERKKQSEWKEFSNGLIIQTKVHSHNIKFKDIVIPNDCELLSINDFIWLENNHSKFLLNTLNRFS